MCGRSFIGVLLRRARALSSASWRRDSLRVSEGLVGARLSIVIRRAR